MDKTGIYIVKCITSNNTTTKRLIIQ
ncbi:MAG: T9SS type A sorting domain-containing protein [Bacteroidales bacterium]|nr:T9SS type A sorting domain-containing protein [Bacteroidales bacterium]MBR3914386.1 T9SS type A sorting domain-containing protein [Bacteroidales bacterium]